MLPFTGSLPGNPNGATTAFTNDGEIAQAGYYSAKSNQPDTITSEFTATPHSAMGRFTYPATTQAGFLIKLRDSQNGQFAASTAQMVNGNEVSGSETSGHFCGEGVNDGQRQEYTVHFDITFDRPFTASQIVPRSDGTPSAVYLTFDTSANPVVQAKLGISYVSDGNARLNRQTENPGWDFDGTKTAAQDEWNALLGRIQVSGGSVAQTQQFYSNLYKTLIQPNITSDVNGQYVGADMTTHTTVAGQHDQYGVFSGWDTFHSLSQLQAILDPAAASDQAQSLVNYYTQDKILQQWGYLHLNNYVMVGDPAQSIIADYYAFGARDFDTGQALKDMLAQATTVNDVRPGEAFEAQYGYLPEDGRYGCCNPHGYVPTLLEYDSQDLALSQFAAALGDTKNAAILEARANNWQNVFDLSNNLLNGRNADGSFVPGITPTSTTRYVEGTAYEYLWNVPNNYPALFSLLGGKTKVVPALREFLSQPDASGTHALLTNEFGFGEQYALDYAGDPAGTQQAVNNIRNTMYGPGPSGLADNDDLGANSSAFVWEMLGMYPENSGISNLVFNSPGFPYAAISLPNGKTITINAPGASPTQYYVSSLKINGSPYSKLYVPWSTLSAGATLDWKLTTSPTTWGNAPAAAPPSFTAGQQSVLASVDPSNVVLQPGASATATLLAANDSDSVQKVTWTATAGPGLTVSPAQGTLNLAASKRASAQVTVAASPDAADGRYTVTFDLTTGNGEQKTVTLAVAVAKRGELWPYYTNAGITDDTDTSAATYDGGGWSYSAQALAAQGVTPGSTVTVDGIDYTWPDVPVATLDNIEAAGQTIPLDAPAHASTIGLLGSSTNAGSAGAGGTATITYTDGSTDQFTAKFSDWTLGAGGFPPLPGNSVAVSMPYRNFTGNVRDNVGTNVFAMEAPVSVAKTVSSITLPQATGGDMHVLAISLPPAPAHAVTVAPTTQKGGGRVGSDATFTEHLTNAGYQADSYAVSSSSTWTAHVYDASCTDSGRHDGDGSAGRERRPVRQGRGSRLGGERRHERHHDHGDLRDRPVGHGDGEADDDRGVGRHARRRRGHGLAERRELLRGRPLRERRGVQLLGPVGRPDAPALDADHAQERRLVHRQRLPGADHAVRVGARDVPRRRRAALHVGAGHPRPVRGHDAVRPQLPARQLGRLGGAERQADGERARCAGQRGDRRHRLDTARPLGAQCQLRGRGHADRPRNGGVHRRHVRVGRAQRHRGGVQGRLPRLPVRGVRHRGGQGRPDAPGAGLPRLTRRRGQAHPGLPSRSRGLTRRRG